MEQQPNHSGIQHEQEQGSWSAQPMGQTSPLLSLPGEMLACHVCPKLGLHVQARLRQTCRELRAAVDQGSEAELSGTLVLEQVACTHGDNAHQLQTSAEAAAALPADPSISVTPSSGSAEQDDSTACSLQHLCSLLQRRPLARALRLRIANRVTAPPEAPGGHAAEAWALARSMAAASAITCSFDQIGAASCARLTRLQISVVGPPEPSVLPALSAACPNLQHLHVELQAPLNTGQFPAWLPAMQALPSSVTSMVWDLSVAGTEGGAWRWESVLGAATQLTGLSSLSVCLPHNLSSFDAAELVPLASSHLTHLSLMQESTVFGTVVHNLKQLLEATAGSVRSLATDVMEPWHAEFLDPDGLCLMLPALPRLVPRLQSLTLGTPMEGANFLLQSEDLAALQALTALTHLCAPLEATCRNVRELSASQQAAAAEQQQQQEQQGPGDDASLQPGSSHDHVQTSQQPETAPSRAAEPPLLPQVQLLEICGRKMVAGALSTVMGSGVFSSKCEVSLQRPNVIFTISGTRMHDSRCARNLLSELQQHAQRLVGACNVCVCDMVNGGEGMTLEQFAASDYLPLLTSVIRQLPQGVALSGSPVLAQALRSDLQQWAQHGADGGRSSGSAGSTHLLQALTGVQSLALPYWHGGSITGRSPFFPSDADLQLLAQAISSGVFGEQPWALSTGITELAAAAAGKGITLYVPSHALGAARACAGLPESVMPAVARARKMWLPVGA